LNTLDNPGWTLTVDLDQTSWANGQVERRFTERTEQDWVHWKVANNQFRAERGPGNLVELLVIFRSWIETTPPITNH
jgi:Immunity protein 53